MKTQARKAAAASALLALSGLLFAGCGGGNKTTGTAGASILNQQEAPDAAELGPANVNIVNFGYEDETFTVAAGTPVVWANEGSAPHTVTGDNFDSGVIRPGKGYSYTFDEPGTYEYWCTNHEGVMFGTIVVE